MENHRQTELLVNYLTGMANVKESEEALQWINMSEENKTYFKQLRAVYEAAKITQKDHDYHPDLSWERVRARHYKQHVENLLSMHKENRHRIVLQFLKYAAVIAVAFCLSLFGYKYLPLKTGKVSRDVMQTIEAPVGSRSNIILADGSNIWLNAGSTLRYSPSFGSKNREVYLEGEAFFNVTQDFRRQFIVKARGIDIKVFGTKFNVKAYAEEDYVQTTLVEGSVTLEGDLLEKTGAGSVVLEPRQVATIALNKESDVITVDSGINTDVYASWKENRWVFDGETLGDLAVKLERRYNVSINILTDGLSNYRFTGIIKDETLQQVLNMIRLSAPIQYEFINASTINLTENKTFKSQYDKMLIEGAN